MDNIHLIMVHLRLLLALLLVDPVATVGIQVVDLIIISHLDQETGIAQIQPAVSKTLLLVKVASDAIHLIPINHHKLHSIIGDEESDCFV